MTVLESLFHEGYKMVSHLWFSVKVADQRHEPIHSLRPVVGEPLAW